jgi:hypothetical protein
VNRRPGESDFLCLHCRIRVSTGAAFSGVCNRNHCPNCLWSRHLDWREPGDRLSSCKGAMRPVGLTVKAVRKKYGGDRPGELMVIHACIECGSVSINRIAADDREDVLADVFFGFEQEAAGLRAGLPALGIRPLRREDWPAVRRQLYGASAAVDG